MAKYILAGCDHHTKDNLILVAVDDQTPEKLSFRNTDEGRGKMIRELKRRQEQAGATAILFAYESSGLGYSLYDELTEAEVLAFVLAPSKMPRSPKQRKDKTDERDARDILGILRGHVLAGNELPAVWVPDPETRANRSLVRTRLEVADKVTATKNQIHGLLKAHGLKKPASVGGNWTVKHLRWLEELTESQDSPLELSNRLSLASLLRQLQFFEGELAELDRGLKELAAQPRYAHLVRELCTETGVGTLTALVFLTEMGDLSRFENRRQIGAYLGLVPAKWESGDVEDRKGHITRQGPARVRKVLNQAVRSRMVHHPETRAFFKKLDQSAARRKKIYVVAHMRKLAILLWHRGVAAQCRAGSHPDSQRR